MATTELTVEDAQAGCDTQAPCNSSFPLVSFSDNELDDQPFMVACTGGPVTECESGRVLGDSMASLQRFKLYRTLDRVGLNATNGYWTHASKTGLWVDRRYMNPYTDEFLLGESTGGTGVKPWLCVCV